MNRFPRLDFANSLADVRSSRFAVLSIFGLVLGIEIGLIGWQYQESASAWQLLDNEQVRLQKRLKQVQVSVISKELNARLLDAQSMVSSLSIPWEGLLSALEVAHEGRVIVESIRPEVATSRVEIGVLASDFAEISAFMARLSATKSLRQVVLLSETPIPGAKGLIRFVLSAVWNEVP